LPTNNSIIEQMTIDGKENEFTQKQQDTSIIEAANGEVEDPSKKAENKLGTKIEENNGSKKNNPINQEPKRAEKNSKGEIDGGSDEDIRAEIIMNENQILEENIQEGGKANVSRLEERNHQLMVTEDSIINGKTEKEKIKSDAKNEEKIKDLEETIKEKEEEVLDIVRTRNRKEEKIEELDRIIEQNRLKFENMRAEMSRLVQDNQQLRAANQNLNNSDQQKEDKIQALSNTNKEQVIEINQLSLKVSEAMKVIEKMEKRIEEKEKEIHRLKLDLQTNKNTTESLTGEEKWKENVGLCHETTASKEKQHQIKVPYTKNEQYQDEKPQLKNDIDCLITSPPPQVSTIHKQITQKLKTDLMSKGINLIEGDSGPAIVVAVNNSRIAADVKRDVARAGILNRPILLLIIKATRKLDEKPYFQIADFNDDRIEEVCIFLVDPSFTKLHTCKLNIENFNTAKMFLTKFVQSC